MTQKVRRANTLDVDNLTELLEKAGLSTEGLKENVDNFMVMEQEHGKLMATIGIEPLDSDGLLRSLVISEEVKGMQLFSFFQGILTYAEKSGYERLFLLTHKADSCAFFENFGFKQSTETPDHIQNSTHYQQAIKAQDPITMVFPN